MSTFSFYMNINTQFLLTSLTTTSRYVVILNIIEYDNIYDIIIEYQYKFKQYK